MEKIRFVGATHFFGAPPGWNEDKPEMPCGVLPLKAHMLFGEVALSSYWKPSADELRMLNEGGFVCLTVVGGSHPPVCMGVEKVEEVKALRFIGEGSPE